MWQSAYLSPDPSLPRIHHITALLTRHLVWAANPDSARHRYGRIRLMIGIPLTYKWLKIFSLPDSKSQGQAQGLMYSSSTSHAVVDFLCALFLGELPGLTCSCPYKVSFYELALQPRIPRSLLKSTMHQIPSLCTCHICVREQREVPWIIRHP